MLPWEVAMTLALSTLPMELAMTLAQAAEQTSTSQHEMSQCRK
jgi:hypothetical protein